MCKLLLSTFCCSFCCGAVIVSSSFSLGSSSESNFFFLLSVCANFEPSSHQMHNDPRRQRYRQHPLLPLHGTKQLLLLISELQKKSICKQKMDSYDWFVENYQRPLLILTIGMLLYNLPVLIYKLQLTFQAVLYLLFCHDKSWKKPQDPASFFSPVLSSGGDVGRKTIYFVRHGESTWNDTFNKGNHRSALVFVIGFIPGLIKAVMYEMYLLISGKMDR